MQSKQFAAIDIGSNAIRMLVNNIIPYQGSRLFKKANIIRLPIRLGADVFMHGKISDANMARVIDAMHAFKHIFNIYNIHAYRACATSAMRHAENASTLLQKIKKETGILIDIISGEEEADIIYATHVETLLNDKETYLYVDVGGGSTECTLFKKGKVVTSRSFKIGTIRILHNIVTDDTWHEFKKWLRKITKQTGKLHLIGSGGNINKVFKQSLKKAGTPLSFNDVQNFYTKIRQYSYEEKITLLDYKPDRADVIEPALHIFMTVFNMTKAKKIYIPKIGLADGIIRQLAEKYDCK